MSKAMEGRLFVEPDTSEADQSEPNGHEGFSREDWLADSPDFQVTPPLGLFTTVAVRLLNTPTKCQKIVKPEDGTNGHNFQVVS